MAYVPMSTALRNAIYFKIEELRRTELHTLGPIPPVAVTSDEVTAAAWGEHIHLKDQMPLAWQGRASQVRVMVAPADGKGGPQYVETQNLVPHIRVPPDRGSGLVQAIISADDPRAIKYNAHQREVAEMNEKWNKVNNTIMAFIDGCKSLNEAVKLMPELTPYIPSQYMRRLEEKVTKAKRTTEAEVPDQDSREHLIASFVAARMAETGK